jgi:hypothetical protein
MNPTIKILEEIGQSTSLNQFDSIKEMLNDLNEYEDVNTLLKKDNDLVCGQFQEDEDEEEDTDKDTKTR